ncbi:MAG: DUF4185 domain-containing protein [bacterium]|nr:DUF4185 domain-containing protein [bacterium]
MKKLIVENSRDLGCLFTDNPLSMIGQDGAYSIPIGPGTALWLFGDTFIGGFNEIGKRIVEKMVSNTGLICRYRDDCSDLTNFSYLTDEQGAIQQLITFEPDEDPDKFRIWGMHGCCIKGKVYWYYTRVKLLEHGQWPFKFKMSGTGLAVADYPALNFNRIKCKNSTIWWEKNEPCFGVAVLPDFENNIAYIYGSYLKNGHHFCALASAPVNCIDDISAYEYLVSAEPRWGPDLKKAIPVLCGMPTEMSVSYNPHLQCYLAVFSYETSGKILGCTAPHPWGPWSEPAVLWTPRVDLRNPLVYKGPLVYAGKEHPELARENGKIIYLTCVEFEEYFPRLIEIVLQ